MKHLKQPIARRANLEDDCTGHFFEQRFYSGALLTEEALVAAMAYIDLNPVRAGLARRIEDIRDCSIHERLQANSADALEAYLRPVVAGLAPPPAAGPEPAAAGGRAGQENPVVAVGPASPPGDLAAPVPASQTPDRPPAHDAAGNAATAGGPAQARGPAAAEAGPRPDAPAASPRLPPPAVGAADYVALLRGIADAELGDAARPSNRVGDWVARTQSLKKRQRAYGTTPALRKWALDRNLQPRESPLPA